MTEFERQVAEALQAIFYEWRETPPPQENRRFGEYAARRVAAAIEAIANPWAADIEHEYGSGRVPDGAHYGEIIGRAQELALAALRGTS